MPSSVEVLPATLAAADRSALHALLRDAVEGGASVGYVVPLPEPEVGSFWDAVLAEVSAGSRVLLAIRDAGRIVGSAQLELAQKPNSRHRCELQKLLVLRSHRGRGLGTVLMAAAEQHARRHGRSLIVLDTSASGNALGLYDRCGYQRGGAIPGYAANPDGSLIDTIIYYKHLAP